MMMMVMMLMVMMMIIIIMMMMVICKGYNWMADTETEKVSDRMSE